VYNDGNEVYLCFVTPDTVKECSKHSQHRYTGDEYWYSADFEGAIQVVYQGRVKVPAGTFDSCYYARVNDFNVGWIYAPDLGLVKTVTVDGTYLALREYTLHGLGLARPRVTAGPEARAWVIQYQPRAGRVSIRFSHPGLSGRLRISGADGRTVKGFTRVRQEHIWDPGTARTGVYFIEYREGKKGSLGKVVVY
jgi:hypothetical protein